MRQKSNALKSTIFFILLSLFINSSSLPLRVFATESYDFANFTEAESMAFVEDCEIEIPEEFYT